jgi:transcription elongation factor GreA
MMKRMMTQDVFLTEDGRQRALAQLEFLRTVKRAEVARYLQEAQEAGDVIDNAAYEDAKNAQLRLESRILELEQMLAAAKTISNGSTQEISLGSVALVRGVEGREYRYTLVGAYEAKPAAGLISNESPVGKALLGRKVGDVVTVSTPGGVKEYTVLRIE